MGRGYTQYKLQDSGREEWVLFSAFLDYRFADGRKLHILQVAAWCHKCDRFVVAEEIPSIDWLRIELEKTQSGDSETIQIWNFVSNGQSVAIRIAELEKRIEWRNSRANPPRCLECGSFGIVALPGGKEFRHPKTGELVYEVSAGWADAERWSADFTPEGDTLDEPSDAPKSPVGREFES